VVALSLLDQKVPGSSTAGDKKFLTSGTKEKRNWTGNGRKTKREKEEMGLELTKIIGLNNFLNFYDYDS